MPHHLAAALLALIATLLFAQAAFAAGGSISWGSAGSCVQNTQTQDFGTLTPLAAASQLGAFSALPLARASSDPGGNPVWVGCVTATTTLATVTAQGTSNMTDGRGDVLPLADVAIGTVNNPPSAGCEIAAGQTQAGGCTLPVDGSTARTLAASGTVGTTEIDWQYQPDLPANQAAGAYTGGQVTLIATAAEPAPPTNTQPPAITGTPEVGDTLGVSTGTWSGDTPTYAYSWADCNGSNCTPIAGATQSTYAPAASDDGFTLEATVTATNDGGSTNATSAPTAVVTQPPTNTAPPTLSSTTPTVGTPISVASNGSWSGYPAPTFTYTWSDCTGATCTPIPGASASSYTPQASDAGFSIKATVTATNTAGSASASSAQTQTIPQPSPPPVNQTLPVLTPTSAQQGTPEHTTNGSWTNSPASFAYAWSSCGGSTCTTITGATNATYVPQASDVGQTLKSTVTATNNGGLGHASSAQTSAVLPPNGASSQFTDTVSSQFTNSLITQGPDGNLWVANPGAAAIQRITPAGVTTNFAVPGGSQPCAITAGPDGNIWFLAQSSPKVGKITPSGTITTFALTSGDSPTGIVAGPDGNLWFTKEGVNQVVRITTAGTMTAFTDPTSGANPRDITLGPNGQLWFTQNNQSQIGEITTSGTFTQFPLPGIGDGIASGPDGKLWVTLTSLTEVASVTTTGTVTAYHAPITLNFTESEISAGPDGALWVSPGNNSQILRVTTAGAFSQYWVPSGDQADSITSGPGGFMWYVGGKSVGEITPPMGTNAPVATAQPTTTQTPPSAINPVVVTSNGSWSNSPTSFTYQWYQCSGVVCTVIPGATSSSYAPTNAQVGLTLQVAVIASNASGAGESTAIQTVPVVSSTPVNTVNPAITPTAPQQGSPETISNGTWTNNPAFSYQWLKCQGSSCTPITGASSSTYTPAAGDVGDTLEATVTATNAGGTASATSNATSTVLPPNGAVSASVADSNTGFSNGLITSGSDGNLWVANTSGQEIQRITPAGVVTNFPVPGGSLPYAVTLGPDGNVWFLAQSTPLVGKITPSGTITTYPLTSGDCPNSIVAGSDGNLWFTKECVNQIVRVTTSGTMTAFTVPTANSDPLDITAGPNGQLWFTEANAAQVGEVTTSGTFTQFQLPGDSNGIATGSDGNVWITLPTVNEVAKVTTSGAVTTTTTPTGQGWNGDGITAGADGSLWIAPSSVPQLWRLTTAGVLTQYFVPSGDDPQAVTSGPGGQVWFDGTQSVGEIAPPMQTGSPTASVRPAVTAGQPVQGQQISVTSTGSWSNSPSSFSYQWFSCSSAVACTAIGGATSSSFTPGSGQVGQDLQVAIIASNAAGSGESTSVITAAVKSAVPTVQTAPALSTKNVQQGTSLSTSQGTWGNSPTSFSYQWLNCQGTTCTPISGATSSTYTPAASDVGTTLEATVTASNALGSTSSTTSASQAVLPPAGAGADLAVAAAGSLCTEELVTGSDGNLWLGNTNSKQIDKITPSGTVTGFSIPTGADPCALTLGPDGNVWFAAISPPTVGNITPSGTVTDWSAGTNTSPQGITAAPDGNLYFTEGGANAIVRLTTSGAMTSFTTPLSGAVPNVITSGPDGALWFTETSQPDVGRMTTSGSFTEIATGATQGNGIVAGSDGNVWATDTVNNDIVRITSAGVVTHFTDPITGAKPFDIVAGDDGALWFGQDTQPFVGRIDTSGKITEWSVPSGGHAAYVAVGPDRYIWYDSTVSLGKLAPEFAPGAPANTVLPTLTDTAPSQNNNDSVASTGTWTNNPTSFLVQWYHCTANDACTAIAGATSTTYRAQLSDVGMFLQVAVTAANAAGEAQTTTLQTAAVARTAQPGGVQAAARRSTQPASPDGSAQHDQSRQSPLRQSGQPRPRPPRPVKQPTPPRAPGTAASRQDPNRAPAAPKTVRVPSSPRLASAGVAPVDGAAGGLRGPARVPDTGDHGAARRDRGRHDGRRPARGCRRRALNTTRPPSGTGSRTSRPARTTGAAARTVPGRCPTDPSERRARGHRAVRAVWRAW